MKYAFSSTKTNGIICVSQHSPEKQNMQDVCVWIGRWRCVCIYLSTGRERCVLRNWLMGLSRLSPKDGKAEMKSTQPVDSVELDSPPVLRGVVSSPASPGNSETRFSFISGKVTTYVLSVHFPVCFLWRFLLFRLSCHRPPRWEWEQWGND